MDFFMHLKGLHNVSGAKLEGSCLGSLSRIGLVLQFRFRVKVSGHTGLLVFWDLQAMGSNE